MKRLHAAVSARVAAPARGFTLIELMVAIALGLLVSLGLVTLFGATSKTSRIQNAMAQMQENGRFAVQRMNYDLRMASRQLVNVNGFSQGATGSNGVVGWSNAPEVFITTLPFPDMVTPLGKPTGWSNAATQWWPLSPRYFFQGYECSTGPCSPTEPASSGAKLNIPAAGTSLGSRVPNSDVAVMRYLVGDGLSMLGGDFTVDCGGTAGIVTLTLSAAAAASTNIASNDLVMVTSSSFSGIFQVTKAGAVLTPSSIINSSFVPCVGSSTGQVEATLFNFSRNFVTVAYWLQLTADPNDATHLIPSLYRTQADNTGTAATPQELVQGVEQMDFLYGVQDVNGAVSYATASQMSIGPNALTCSNAPSQYQPPAGQLPATPEAGCLWRSIKSVEAHLLVNSVTNMYDLGYADLAYRYNSGYSTTMVFDGLSAPPATMPSGLPFGRVLRREFVAFSAQRNYNP